MTELKGRTLKSKLLQIVVSTMVLAGFVTLVSFVWTNYRLERARLTEVEAQIYNAVSGKASTLAASHALALKGLAADNAIGDIRHVVAKAVTDDADLVYWLFLSAEGQPWAYASPTHPYNQTEGMIEDGALEELKLRPELQGTGSKLDRRKLRAFDQDIEEWSAPVWSDEGERLGTVIYGFSIQRTRAALEAAGQRSRQALARAFLISFAIGALSVLVGIARVMRSSARITQPLATLTGAANQIAKGKRGLRVDVESDDEIQVLAAAFNQMLEANEQAMRSLEITTERALAADRLKSEFLANMSHEIRTPMNGVLGMIKLIQAQHLEGKLLRYVNTIDASAHALLTVINDILDFSKLEAGKYTLLPMPFQPRHVLQEVVELMASRAQEKGIALIHRVAPDVPTTLVGDPDRFRQILTNLIGNAIKFTERGEVFVNAELAPEQHASTAPVAESTGPGQPTDDLEAYVLRVAVQDTGVGIAEVDLPKLFQAFSQVDGTMVRKYGGTGLGLAIVKRLVLMMGGDIEVVSQPGRGSTFSFTARLGRADAHSETVLPPLAAEPPRVLVAEGQPRFRQVIEEHLRVWQMQPEVHATAAQALQALMRLERAELPFDAVIVSDTLPDSSPAQLIRAVRAQPGCQTVAVIVLSSTVGPSLSPDLQAELHAQLYKPLRFSELYNALAAALPRAKQPPSAAADRPGEQHAAARPQKWRAETLLQDSPQQEPEQTEPYAPISRKRVLVVDDNEINRFVVVEELERRGYRLDQAADGQQALAMFERGEYLCILMDCQMPVLDGYEATRLIRQLENERGLPRTPIVALTAHALVGERERVFAAGMDEFLSKPFRPAALEKLLRSYAKRASHNPPRQQVSQQPTSPQAADLNPDVKRSEKLTRLFLEHMPGQLRQLQSALAHADAAEVRALAHKIKGSCLAVAADRMAQTAAMLQKQAETKQMQAAAQQASELLEQHARVVEQLRAELGASQAGKTEPD